MASSLQAPFVGRRKVGGLRWQPRSPSQVAFSDLFTSVFDSSLQTKEVNPIGRMYWGVKEITRQGIFTTSTQDPDWKKAHKILMPVSPFSSYFQSDIFHTQLRKAVLADPDPLPEPHRLTSLHLPLSRPSPPKQSDHILMR